MDSDISCVYATRYPEAVPLKDIHVETADAEALVNMFTRVCIPRDILSDQSSQFSFAVTKQMCRLLSVEQLISPRTIQCVKVC